MNISGFKAFAIGFSICVLAIVTDPAQSEPASCEPVDFLRIDLGAVAERLPVAAALEFAYPSVHVDVARNEVEVSGLKLVLHDGLRRDAREALDGGSIQDQFLYAYPLDFQSTQRDEPWFDPGRVRNDRFFLALYGADRAAVRSDLSPVTLVVGEHRFLISNRQGAACQFSAAVKALREQGLMDHPVFRDPGGSFNWRFIAGTKRLSAHSYGIAFDLNAEMGGYWRWSGAKEGAVGKYTNRIPREVVETFERFGFIWGGKWHHFDGMHFEYRPELIVYSRIKGEI